MTISLADSVINRCESHLSQMNAQEQAEQRAKRLGQENTDQTELRRLMIEAGLAKQRAVQIFGHLARPSDMLNQMRAEDAIDYLRLVHQIH